MIPLVVTIGRFRPLTPKEFAVALGGLRSAAWVRLQCKRGSIATIGGRRCRPYLIAFAELARFRPCLPRWLVIE